MNHARLQELRKLAQQIQDDQAWLARFNLRDWTNARFHEQIVLTEQNCVLLKDPEPGQQGCGTVACMIGWAGQHEPFVAEGFCLKTSVEAFIDPVPTFQGLRNWSAVQQFFGITSDEAYNLFTDRGYQRLDDNFLTISMLNKAIQPKHVIENIDALLRGEL